MGWQFGVRRPGDADFGRACFMRDGVFSTDGLSGPSGGGGRWVLMFSEERPGWRGDLSSVKRFLSSHDSRRLSRSSWRHWCGGGCRWRALPSKACFRHVLSEEARPNRALATGSHSTTAPAGLTCAAFPLASAVAAGAAAAASPWRRLPRRLHVEDQFREGFGLKRGDAAGLALIGPPLLLRGRLPPPWPGVARHVGQLKTPKNVELITKSTRDKGGGPRSLSFIFTNIAIVNTPC